MSPHRLNLSVAQAALPPDPTTVGVLAGLAALFGSFWSLHIVVLFLWAGAAGIADLLAGANRAMVLKRMNLPGSFERTLLDQGVARKLTHLGFSIFAGMSADIVGSLFAGAGNLAVEPLIQSYTPGLAAALLYRVWRDYVSMLENIEETPGGRDAIWPGARKFIDLINWKSRGGKGPLPHDRWGDISEKERVQIESFVEELRRTARPPDDP